MQIAPSSGSPKGRMHAKGRNGALRVWGVGVKGGLELGFRV